MCFEVGLRLSWSGRRTVSMFPVSAWLSLVPGQVGRLTCIRSLKPNLHKIHSLQLHVWNVVELEAVMIHAMPEIIC